MEIHGEPAGASSALDRFQQLREAAQNRLTGSVGREGLARAIEEKQREFQKTPAGNLRLSATDASRAAPGADFLQSAGQSAGKVTGQTLHKVSELLLYGRDTSLKKESAGPKVLGNYVDRMA